MSEAPDAHDHSMEEPSPLNGILIIDKPIGPTSMDICSRVRWVRTSMVVPMSTMRNRKRSGVMTKTFTMRADSQTGVMSP